MASHKHATILYHALDRYFSNFVRRLYIEDRIATCWEAIYDFTGKDEGVGRHLI